MPTKVIKPVVSANEAVQSIKDGSTIMIGGFNYGGIPYTLVDALVEKGVKDLTIISNDAAYADVGHGRLIKNGQVKKIIASHVGLNKMVQKLYKEGQIELELIPQGTLVERIRAGGFGLGGFLTPTGVGTIVEEGKQVLEVEGKKYILELPLKADVSLVRAYKADRLGNLIYYGTNRNFNPTMATASKLVIAEVDSVVKEGEILPDNVVTPGIFVNLLVVKGDSYHACCT